jgi:hypothetical protein
MNDELMRHIVAARVPESLKPQTFGLWEITRLGPRQLGRFGEQTRNIVDPGFDSVTFLKRYTLATLHQDGETVMEDSLPELRKHLPIWIRAIGKVLVTGLGLGCVIRGLLAKPDVERVTVIEIDKDVLRVVGHEFASNRRVELILANALRWEPRGRMFDWAWHDIWCEGPPHVSVLHMKLIKRFARCANHQGSWGMPRWAKRKLCGDGEEFFTPAVHRQRGVMPRHASG